MNCELLKHAVLFRLKNRCGFGNSAKIALSDEAVMEIIGPAPVTMTADEAAKRLADAKKRLNGKVQLLNSPEYSAIKAFQSDVKREVLRQYCNASFIDNGIYTVKRSALPELIARLEEAKQHLRLFLVTAFKDVYIEQKQAAKPVLGPVWSDSLYPDIDTLDNAFDISWRVIQLDIPEGLPPEIREAEEKKLRDTYEAAKQAIIGALWSEFQKFLGHIVERLTPGEDGKRKRFDKDILGNLTEFVSAFNNRNTFNDSQLQSMVDKANEIIASAKGNGSIEDVGELLKTDELLRAGVADALAKVKAQVDESIKTIPGRTVLLDAEEGESEAV